MKKTYIIISILIVVALSGLYWFNGNLVGLEDENKEIEVQNVSVSKALPVAFPQEIVWKDFVDNEMGIAFKYPPEAEVDLVLHDDQVGMSDPVYSEINVKISFGEEEKQKPKNGRLGLTIIHTLFIRMEVSDCSDEPSLYKGFSTTLVGDVWKIVNEDDIYTTYFIKRSPQTCYSFIAQKPDPKEYKDPANELIKNIFTGIRFIY